MERNKNRETHMCVDVRGREREEEGEGGRRDSAGMWNLKKEKGKERKKRETVRKGVTHHENR